MVYEFSQSEIENFDLACGRNEDVGRFDIPVNDALDMRGNQSVRHLYADIQQFFEGHGVPGNLLL